MIHYQLLVPDLLKPIFCKKSSYCVLALYGRVRLRAHYIKYERQFYRTYAGTIKVVVSGTVMPGSVTVPANHQPTTRVLPTQRIPVESSATGVVHTLLLTR